MNARGLTGTFFVIGAALGQIIPVSAQQPPDSAEARQIVELVDKAAVEVSSKGRAAFDEFRTPNSEWRNGDIYLFGENMNGTIWFSVGTPQLEGSDVSWIKDANGKLFNMEMVKTAQDKGAGWVDYVWPKPGGGQPAQKWTYVKAVKLGGSPGLVAAGFYPQ